MTSSDTLLAAASALAGMAAGVGILVGSRFTARRRARRHRDIALIAQLVDDATHTGGVGDQLMAVAAAAGVVTLPLTANPSCGVCGRPMPWGQTHRCSLGSDYRPGRVA